MMQKLFVLFQDRLPRRLLSVYSSWVKTLLIGRFGIDTQVTPSVVTSTYNNHTQAAIDSGSKEVALAAMLPCMWIYNEVGLYIRSIASLEEVDYRCA